MEYYQINNKVYYLNLENLFAMVTQTPSVEKPVNTTITQYYSGAKDGNLDNGKEIIETKSNLNETMNNVRYDLLKNIVTCLLSDQYNNDGVPMSVHRLEELSFAQGLCLNTLIEYKILCEVESND